MPSGTSVPEASVATRLRRFARHLSRHPLVEVVEHRVGRRVPQDRLSRYQNLVPNDLLALYAEMDGFTFEWRFRGDPRPFAQGNGGRFHLPTLARNSRTFADRFTFEIEDIEPFVVDLGPLERGAAVTSVVQGNGQVLLYDGDFVQDVGGGVARYLEAAMQACFTYDWLVHWWDWGNRVRPTFGADARRILGLGGAK